MWCGTSSLPVRFILSILERGITDKGAVSPYCRGCASPSNTIKSSFLLSKSVFQCCLCHPDKGLHIPPVPVPTECLCLHVSVLQDTVEGAQLDAALLLLLMTVTCDRHWVLLRDCLVPHPLGGHSYGSLNAPSPWRRARHSHKTRLLCFHVFPGIISLRWILGRNAKETALERANCSTRWKALCWEWLHFAVQGGLCGSKLIARAWGCLQHLLQWAAK